MYHYSQRGNCSPANILLLLLTLALLASGITSLALPEDKISNEARITLSAISFVFFALLLCCTSVVRFVITQINRVHRERLLHKSEMHRELLEKSPRKTRTNTELAIKGAPLTPKENTELDKQLQQTIERWRERHFITEPSADHIHHHDVQLELSTALRDHTNSGGMTDEVYDALIKATFNFLDRFKTREAQLTSGCYRFYFEARQLILADIEHVSAPAATA